MGPRRRPNEGSELIEVFDPSVEPSPEKWADDGHDQLPPPAPGRATGVALAAVAAMLTAAITVAIITDDGGRRADRPEEPATTAAPSTTRPLLSPVDPALANRQFIADPTAVGLRLYSADILSPAPAGQEVRLWATGNGRRWMLVETGTGQRTHAVVGGERRLVAAVGRDPVEVADLSRARVDGEQISVASRQEGERWAMLHAFGFRDADLAAVVSALDPASGPDSVSQVATETGAGRPIVRGASVYDELFGEGRSAMRYLTPSGGEVVLRVGEGEFADGSAGRTALSVQLERGETTSGRLVTSGEFYVTWEHEGRIATLLSTAIPSADLRAIVDQVRVADAQQWRALLYGSRPDYRLGDYVVTASGLAPSGGPWRAGVQSAVRAGRDEYLWWWDLPGDPSRSASVPAPQELALASTAVALDVVVVPGATFVFVAAPDTSAPRVTRVVDGDGVVHELTFVRPFDNAPFTVAVVRTEAFGPVAAAE
ncbi:MAG TPA: hypothetical protein DCR14_12415 [Acidimicrobiaceae bacterium]|nr:hypothetical protein [Acidimicrobiaceae bacterium]